MIVVEYGDEIGEDDMTDDRPAHRLIRLDGYQKRSDRTESGCQHDRERADDEPTRAGIGRNVEISLEPLRPVAGVEPGENGNRVRRDPVVDLGECVRVS